MPVKHRPFGISQAAAATALERQRQAFIRRIAPQKAELERLQARVRELPEYSRLLREEITALELAERDLLRELAPGATRAEAPPDPLTELRAALAAYRTQQIEISAGVLSLIAPFLTKEEAAWPSSRTAERSG